MERLSRDEGVRSVRFSQDHRYYLESHSGHATLPSLRLRDADGALKSTPAPPRTDLLAGLDLQYPELLTVPAAHANAFLRAIFEAIDFGTFDVIGYSDLDFNALNCGSSDHDVVTVCHEQDALKVKFFTLLCSQTIHFNGSPFDDAVLLAAAFNNCISH